MAERDHAKDADERVQIPLDAQEALKALLKVDPDSEPTEERPDRKPPTAPEDGH